MRAVNLLPPDLRSGPKGSAPAVSTGVENSGAGAFVVLGVLAFAVVALAAYVLAGNTVKDRQAELAAVTAKSAAVTKEATALKPYADFESVTNARVQTVTDLANSRFDWDQALRDLSRAVPTDVTIGSFKGDLGGDTAAAGGGGGIRGAITAPAITLTGCTYSQTKVATLMARLRTIDGVTRVSLAKSDKEASGACDRPQRAEPDRLLRQGRRARLRGRRLLRGRQGCQRRPGDRAGRHDHRGPGGDAGRLGDPGCLSDAGRGRSRRRRDARGHPGRRRGARDLRPRVLHDHPVGMTSMKNKSLLIAVVATVAAVAAFWLLALSPKREEAAKLQTKIDEKQAEVASQQATLAEYRKAKGHYSRNYATVVRLGKAVPEDDDVRSLLVQLDSQAGGTNVDFRTIEIGGGGTTAPATGAAATTAAPPPGAVPVGSAGFSAMPFTFSFRGTYTNLSQFFSRMERFVTLRNEKVDVTGRLMRLESIELQVDPKGFPNIRAQIGASSYLVPATQGLTAGATPQGPAASTTAGTPAPAGGPTVPTTTATVPGATP